MCFYHQIDNLPELLLLGLSEVMLCTPLLGMLSWLLNTELRGLDIGFLPFNYHLTCKGDRFIFQSTRVI